MVNLTINRVKEALNSLGKPNNYLIGKPISSWNKDDVNNWNNIIMNTTWIYLRKNPSRNNINKSLFTKIKELKDIKNMVSYKQLNIFINEVGMDYFPNNKSIREELNSTIFETIKNWDKNSYDENKFIIGEINNTINKTKRQLNNK